LGKIPPIPGEEDLLEVAHILPSKPGTTMPVIARFHNCNLHTLCLRGKKDYQGIQEIGGPEAAARSRAGGTAQK
jgi:hypothetical protein